MKKDYGLVSREEGPLVGTVARPRCDEKKNSKRHAAIGASMILLAAGAVCGYAALPGSSTTPVVNVSNMEVSAPSTFVIPEDDEDADLAPTYVPPFSDFDLDNDGKISVEEYLTHLIKLHDAALNRVEVSSLSDLAKDFISDRLRRNYATEAWCVARLAIKDETSTDGVSMDRFKLFYSMIKEFCMVVDPNIPAEFNPVDVPPSVDPQSTDAPNDPSIPITAAPPAKISPSDLPEGQAIKCDLSEPEVYRFTKGERRHYPDPAIAASWDPYWVQFVVADCSSLLRGDDMSMKEDPLPWTPPPKVSPKDLSEGQAIKCDLTEPEVYRFTNGQRRHYPDPAIAASWDPYWDIFVVADCSSLPRGEDMPINGLPTPSTAPPAVLATDLREGQAIKCDVREPEVYRFSNGQLRYYPTPDIAASWDPYWSQFTVVNCWSLPRGEDMTMNGLPTPWTAPPKIPPTDLLEGQAIKCDLSEPEVYRFTNRERRHYPNPDIAASWDPFWSQFLVADCSSLPRGDDMPMKEEAPPTTPPPPPKLSPGDLTDGQAIKCDESETEVFRFVDGQRRHYPTPDIAASWDPYWDVPKIADCSLIPSGPDMPMKPPSIDDGQSVQFRLYPSPAIAESWDPTWNDPHVVDCSSLTTGPDMPLKLSPPTSLPEGQAIKCDPNQAEVYRYSSGQRRWYPNPSIATSWDPFWDMFVLVDCSSLPTGDDMAFNQPILSDGQAVKCDEGAGVFRFTGGMIRLYPDPMIADSWDPVWPSAIRVDCSHIPGGPAMTLKPAPPMELHEGQAIRCDGSLDEVFRFGSGEVRLYPNPTIASSWDPNWNNAALVDCSSLRRGDDMKFNQPAINDGQAVKCSSISPEVFRFANGTIRLYPEPKIADSWDPNWTNATAVDCSFFYQGPPMGFSTANLAEGQAIKCDANEPQVYRFSSDQRRWYPNPAIATSWDPYWDMALVVDCSLLPRGGDMKFNQPSITEGHAVKCDSGPAIYRYTNGSVRWYPDPPIAESWDPLWANPILIDCSDLVRGPDMKMQLPPPTTLLEGHAIKCDPSESDVFRLSSGQRRRYPSPEIATSWDLNWGNFVAVDCSFLPRGADMKFNNPSLTDGQAVKCDNGPAVFRYTNGTIRWYPNPDVATSWDPKWPSAVLVDCSRFPQAKDMSQKLSPPSGLQDGQAVKCDPNRPEVYRYTCGQLRWYPNPDIAASWDPNWKKFVVIDCTWTPIADDMRMFSTATLQMAEGETLKCPDDPETYRYCSGQRRRYVNERCALSWDPEWSAAAVIASCTALPRGNDMLLKRPMVPEGQAVKCDASPNVYRFTGGGIRLYPIYPIAESWDPNWYNAILIDCSFLPRGPDMPAKQVRPVLAEGQAVKCDPQHPAVYRYASGLLRWYPDPVVATSWDQNWSGNITMVNCSVFSRGPDMEFNQPPVTDGQAVKCDAGPNIYRYTNRTIRWYPNPPIAASWDPNWANPILMNCTSFRQDLDMPMRLPPPTGLPEGQAIKCDPSRPEVYRLTGGQRRWYPNPPIASSWDPNWFDLVVVDCSSLPLGADMDYKQPILSEGQAVKCDAGPNIFRYTNGTIRWYPDPPVAASWDPNWASTISVDCSRIPQGPEMSLKLPSPAGLPEGQAIKCNPNQPEVYRLTGGQIRWYPNPPIASSWDPMWFNFATVDCSSLPRGADMPFKQPPIPEGQAVKCDTGPAIFRYTNGTIRLYPDPPTAASWDPNWFNPIYVDCSMLPRGYDLTIRGGNNGWIQLDGSLVQLSFDGKQLCGVNSNDDVWCASENIRGEGPTNWRRLPGKLIQIAVYGDALYGVNRDNKIYFGSAVTSDPNWREIPGWLKQITTDNKQICGVNALGGVFCADTNIRVEPNWRKLPGQFTQVELVNGRLFALRADSAIFSGRAYGDLAWVKLDGLLRQMSYDGVRFCGTNTGDDVWCANSGLLGNPNWALTPGKMRSAVVQAGDLFATDQNGNIFYRRTE